MLQFTLECGSDSQTYPLYINGRWVVNTTMSAVPNLYRYENLIPVQSQYFTTYTK